MGRHFWRSSSPKPLLKTGSYSRFFRTTSRCVVTVLRNGDSQISFLCLTTLMLKKSYFLRLSRVFCILLSAHFLLLLTTKKNLALTFTFPSRYKLPGRSFIRPCHPPTSAFTPWAEQSQLPQPLTIWQRLQSLQGPWLGPLELQLWVEGHMFT